MEVCSLWMATSRHFDGLLFEGTHPRIAWVYLVMIGITAGFRRCITVPVICPLITWKYLRYGWQHRFTLALNCWNQPPVRISRPVDAMVSLRGEIAKI
jgi:hypothetical protein